MTISSIAEVSKVSSSKWLKEMFPNINDFAWQQGYGAFGVSESHRDSVFKYIASQAEHHKAVSFQDELRRLFQDAGIEFDERYLWD